jgi:hypothetical protein
MAEFDPIEDFDPQVNTQSFDFMRTEHQLSEYLENTEEYLDTVEDLHQTISMEGESCWS